MIRSSLIWTLTIGLLLVGLMSSCSVKSDFEGADEEIQQYLTTNNITAEKTASGLYFEITKPGDGAPTEFSNLAVANLRGSLIDGREWLNTSTGEPFRSLLNNQGIIPGLREGLSLFSTGAEGRVIMPPNLGFGNAEFNGIPANSVLIIHIDEINIYEDANAYSDTVLSEYITQNMLDANKTESGLYYTVTEMGSDTMPGSNDRVTVNYRGYFLDGTEFDANDPANGPITFGLNQVIQGWTEGLQLYGKGAKGTLLIPSELAYGANGNQSVPPHTPLLFDIELLDVL